MKKLSKGGSFECQVFWIILKILSDQEEHSRSYIKPMNKSLPICDIVICYGNDHDLGPGWSCCSQNLLQGYANSTQTETEKKEDTMEMDQNNLPESYIYYRRRLPRDKLIWSPKYLQLGDMLDAKDDQNNWCFATIIDTSPHLGMKIHYTRWTSNYDEWIQRTETRRLAEYGTKSTEETKITRGNQHKVSIKLIQTKINTFTKLINEKNYEQIDDFIESQLSMFVSQCIGYSITCTVDEDSDSGTDNDSDSGTGNGGANGLNTSMDESMVRQKCVTKIYELLKLIVKCSVWQLKNKKKSPSIRLLQLLKVALLADTTKNTYSVNYFFEEHGHGENDNESKENQEDESLQGNQGNQNVLEWNSSASSATTTTTMGNDLTKSKYYIQLYNLFGSLGGLNAILERIDGEVGESKDDVQTIDNKPVSDLTGFDITHTSDQMGPIGYRRVFQGDFKNTGNITKQLDSNMHQNGDKIIDTYIWQGKNMSENEHVYDVAIVYGEDTVPPYGYEKCNKTLTPQLNENVQSFLCYRLINEDDVSSLLERKKR